MSHVTSIVLTCSVMEESIENTFPAVDALNRTLNSPLQRLNGHEGGTKAWEIDVFGGAYNYLDLKVFLEFVSAAPWAEPDNVTLLICEGEQDKMTPWRIGEPAPW